MTPALSPYLLLFRDSSPDAYRVLSADERQQILERWTAWYDDLAATGRVRYGHPLEPEGRVVSASRPDRIIDIPLQSFHEAIGGYFFLMVSDLEEATEIARRCPSLRYGMVVEVRPIAECCHLGRLTESPTAVAPAESQGAA